MKLKQASGNNLMRLCGTAGRSAGLFSCPVMLTECEAQKAERQLKVYTLTPARAGQFRGYTISLPVLDYYSVILASAARPFRLPN